MNLYSEMLMNAVRKNNRTVINYLLSKNIDIDTTDIHGQTALMEAVRLENTEMIEFLIHAGANINRRDNYRWTPLKCAVAAGNEQIISLLIEKGAHAENTDNILTMAYSKGLSHCIESLINSGADMNETDHYNNTVIDLAIKNEDHNTIDMLLKKRAAVSKQYNRIAYMLVHAENEHNILSFNDNASMPTAA